MVGQKKGSVYRDSNFTIGSYKVEVQQWNPTETSKANT